MNNVVLGYSIDRQFERKEAVRLVRLALSVDNSDPETLALACVTLAFVAGDYESAVEMADRAVALTKIHLRHGTLEAGSIFLLGCRRKRSGALSVAFG
jgi:hypothetical protein